MYLPILRIWFKVFWLNTTFPWFIRLPTLPTWPLVIFGCSPNWKCRWKGPDLSQEKTLCGTRQPSWTWFHKKLSRNVSSNGRTAGRCVCITKETTLKGIMVSDIQVNNCIFADQRSDTFWTDHVWYGGKNSTFNSQFLQKNVLVKEVSISKYYLDRLTLLRCFPA